MLKSRAKKSENKSKEIIIEWFTHIVEKYSEKVLIDDTEILEIIVKSITLENKTLTKNILTLVCKLSKKNESFLKRFIEMLLN